MENQTAVAWKWVRRLGWGVLAFLALWVVAWAAMPGLLKWQLQKQGSAALGRSVTVDAVEFSPWTLELTLQGLKVASADGTFAQLAVSRLYADVELQSVFRLAPVVDAFAVEAPQLRLTHLGAGRYDIDDLLTRFTAQPSAPDAAPMQFALHNLELKDGSVDFFDQRAGAVQHHEVRKLQLSLPFLSNMDAQREVVVEPRLAFAMNGSEFDSAAQAMPFSASRKTDASLQLQGVDLQTYLPYLPAGLPVRPQAGKFDLKIQAHFEQQPKRRLVLSGALDATGLRVADRAGAGLIKVDRVRVALAEALPLERSLKFSVLEIAAPQLQLRRLSDGRLNIDALMGTGGTGGTNKPAPATPTPPAGTASAPSWALSVDKFALNGGQVQWLDEAIKPSARATLQEIAINAGRLAWPMTAQTPPTAFDARLLVATGAAKDGGSGAAKSAGTARTQRSDVTVVTVKGQGLLQAGKAQWALKNLSLVDWTPYVTQTLVPSLEGRAQAEGTVEWKTGDLGVQVASLTVNDVRLRSAGPAPATPGTAVATGAMPDTLNAMASNTGAARDLASVGQIDVRNVRVSLARKSAEVGQVLLRKPQLRVRREANGQWMFSQWLRSPAAGSAAPDAAPKVAPAAKPPVASSSWTLGLGGVALEEGQATFVDRLPPKPLFLELSSLNLKVGALTLDGKKPTSLALSSVVRSGRADPGRLRFDGTVQWAPVQVAGRVEATDLPLHAATSYVDLGLPVELARADGSFKGQVSYKALANGPSVRVQGDAALADLRLYNARPVPAARGATPPSTANTANTAVVANAPATPPAATSAASSASVPAAPSAATTAAGSEEMLSWKLLSMPGLDFSMAPREAMRIGLREVVLTDVFARLVITPQGQLQLQELVAQDKEAAPAAATAPIPTSAPASAPSSSAAASAPAAPSAPSPGADPLASVIQIGGIRLQNGRVAFSDRFIKPNYSATLSELQGSLSGFSSQPVDGVVQMADLMLQGRAEGSARLDVTGRVNPLAKPLALDIQGRVRDLELSPLSAYSIKYSGYGIERGKMSLDVTYKVQPDGSLTATNRLLLNQLTFGDKVEGSTASLPVKLAVALLADRNGVIDLDIPLSGSLNDPQFSIWPVVWKIVGNVITRALTAPFALFSGLGSSGSELSSVGFEAGVVALSDAARVSLDKVAQALLDRPALKLTVTGTASLERERDAIKRQRLNAMVLAEKRRAATAAGKEAAEVGAFSVAEYPELLAEVYRRSDIRKPRNMVGWTRTLPVPEMETLLMNAMAVNEDSAREVAFARSVAVRDYLTQRKVPGAQLFLGASNIVVTDEAWSPRANLSLSER